MTYVGIDVSKATFVVAYSPAKGSRTREFKNTIKGIHEFIQTISATKHHCVLEATGNYSALLVYLLSQGGIVTSLENPLKIKNFARAMLSVTKTDEKECKTCYDRLRENGKPGKVAVIAVANKLIRQAFAVVKHEQPYINGFISSKV
jgi:transposase